MNESYSAYVEEGIARGAVTANFAGLEKLEQVILKIIRNEKFSCIF